MRPHQGVLLDTHTLMWCLSGNTRVSPRLRNILDSDRSVMYSAISIAEIHLKATIGKLPSQEGLVDKIHSIGLRELPFDSASAASLDRFPGLFRHDPFDRMLLAQASTHKLYFETADTRLLSLNLPGVRDATA